MLAIFVGSLAGLITALLVQKRWLACLCAGLVGGAAAFTAQHYVNLAGDAGWSIWPIVHVGLGSVLAVGVVLLHRAGINEPTNVPRG